MTSLISLPHNLKFSYLYDDKPINLSYWSPLLITPLEDNKVKVETKDGSFIPKTMDEVVQNLSRYSCLFTYSPPGRDDAIFNPLSYGELTVLCKLGKLEINGQELKKVKTTIRIGKTYIFNLISQTKTMHQPMDSLETINQVAKEVIESRSEVGLYNLSSPAAEGRAMMLQDEAIFQEILLSKRLKTENLDKFNAACYGGRMESAGLGSQYQFHLDMVKAHLNILKEYPGLSGTEWVRGSDTRHFDKALPSSIYYIKTTIPDRKYKFNPLPVRRESGIKFPTGDIKGEWYFKDYITLLNNQHIPLKILDSIQFFGTPTYPFRNYMSFVSAMLKLFELNHPDLECKHLYATIAGSCKSIYKKIEKDFHQQHLASRIFDPLVYGFVLSRQNVNLYLDALKTNAEAIKMDSIATHQRHDLGPTYKIKSEGITTYLTPSLKSIPEGGKTLYKTAIKKCKGMDHVSIVVNQWNSLQSYLGDSFTQDPTALPLGGKFQMVYTIKPTYGNRIGIPIKNVGELLQSWLVSTPADKATDQNFGLLKLEDYWERFGDK